jgi:phenylpropionate dioxygenase-like ring-hydroxylating dioxygenase large terminal subunit
MNQVIPLVKAHTGPEAITAEDRHAPGLIYTSEEIFQQEKDQIFMKDWLLVGREEELERAGDYMAMEIMGERIFICRDQSGHLKALSNICLHRGVELVRGSGNKRVFSCPFHGWTYDLHGKLIGAPDQTRHLARMDLYQFRRRVPAARRTCCRT